MALKDWKKGIDNGTSIDWFKKDGNTMTVASENGLWIAFHILPAGKYQYRKDEIKYKGKFKSKAILAAMKFMRTH